ncbi:protein FAR1-related sequence 11 [Tanacetum coccineum]
MIEAPKIKAFIDCVTQQMKEGLPFDLNEVPIDEDVFDSDGQIEEENVDEPFVGQCFLSEEEASMFTLIMKKSPKTILIDQDPWMTQAIAKEMPFTKHAFCIWHITSKFSGWFTSILRGEYSSWCSEFYDLYKLDTVEEFEQQWPLVIGKYKLNENMHVVGLYKIKEFWVPAYLRDFFFDGMTTMGRSKSINAFIKRFISSRTCLSQFIKQVDLAIEDVEQKQMHDTMLVKYRGLCLRSLSPLEEQDRRLFTPFSFKKFQEEFGKSFQYLVKEEKQAFFEVKHHKIALKFRLLIGLRGGVGKSLNLMNSLFHINKKVVPQYDTPMGHGFGMAKNEQLDKEELHVYNSKTCLAVLKKQFEPLFDLKSSVSSSYQYQSELALQKKKFQEYAHYTYQSLKETILSYLNTIEKMIDERACHEKVLRITEKDVKDKQEKLPMEKQETMIQKSKCSSPGDSSDTKREKQEMKENCSKTFQELKKDYDSFAYKFYYNLARLENQMSRVEYHEGNSKTYLIELRKQCEAFLTNGNPKSLDLSMFSYYLEVFQKYILHDIKSMKDILVRYLNDIEKEIDVRAHHEEELARVYDSKARSGTKSKMKDECSKSGNDTHAEGPDIRLSNDIKPLHEVQPTVVYNVNANDRQHAEQPKFINEGKVDQDAEQCIENKTTESLNQTLVSENVCLKKTIEKLQNNFSKLEAQRIAFEIALQHKSNVESNQCDEVKVKVNFDEIETNNIELEHRVSSLLKDNEHLKLVYKNLFDSIKKTRVQKENLRATLSEFSVNHIFGKEDSSPNSTNEFEKESGENICDNAKCEFQTKFVELEKLNLRRILKNLKKTKVVLERQLARKFDGSKAEKDQFLKEINHLRTQLENLKGKRVETKLDNSSILGKPLLLNNERDQLLKQIAFLESKLASQDIHSCQKEYHELGTSYNALKVNFDSLNRKRRETNVSKSSKPKVGVSEKVHTGESSKSFSRRVSQFTTYSLQKDREFSKKSQSFETFFSQKGFKTRASNAKNQSFETSHFCFTLVKQVWRPIKESQTFEVSTSQKSFKTSTLKGKNQVFVTPSSRFTPVKQVWRPKQSHSKSFKYSKSKMLSMQNKNDSASTINKKGRFSNDATTNFWNVSSNDNNKWKSSSLTRFITLHETPSFNNQRKIKRNFKSSLIPRELFSNETPVSSSRWNSTSLHQIYTTLKWFSKLNRPVSTMLKWVPKVVV